jgi:hypothetical protein
VRRWDRLFFVFTKDKTRQKRYLYTAKGVRLDQRGEVIGGGVGVVMAFGRKPGPLLELLL